MRVAYSFLYSSGYAAVSVRRSRLIAYEHPPLGPLPKTDDRLAGVRRPQALSVDPRTMDGSGRAYLLGTKSAREVVAELGISIAAFHRRLKSASPTTVLFEKARADLPRMLR